jgi:hypothetical protein
MGPARHSELAQQIAKLEQPQDEGMKAETQKNVDLSKLDSETRVEDDDDDLFDSDEQDEINFDQLLGDAAQSQADFDEDRDDSLDDDEDGLPLGDGLEYSLSYSKTAHGIETLKK